MLSNLDDRKTFVQIARILAFSEMQTGVGKRLRPISWQDIAELANQERGLS
jgi:hypothetical protein